MSASINVRFIEAGYAKHLEAVSLKGAPAHSIKFPATVAVIEHPKQGVVLFDTGYSMKFFEETKYFPNKFYSLITPVTLSAENSAASQLLRMGIKPGDVKQVILSHFHADHIAGVGDFPSAKYVFRKSAYDAVKNLSAWGSLRAGFLRGLLPSDFEARSIMLSDEHFTVSNETHDFGKVCDYFGDGSVCLVDLPGHALGQIGLMIHAGDSKKYFLVADACWSRQAFMDNRPPAAITKLIFHDWNLYLSTLSKIHDVSVKKTDLIIVPCHCDTVAKEMLAR